MRIAAKTTSRVCRKRQRRLPLKYGVWRVVRLRSVELGSTQPVLHSALDWGLEWERATGDSCRREGREREAGRERTGEAGL